MLRRFGLPRFAQVHMPLKVTGLSVGANPRPSPLCVPSKKPPGMRTYLRYTTNGWQADSVSLEKLDALQNGTWESYVPKSALHEFHAFLTKPPTLRVYLNASNTLPAFGRVDLMATNAHVLHGPSVKYHPDAKGLVIHWELDFPRTNWQQTARMRAPVDLCRAHLYLSFASLPTNFSGNFRPVGARLDFGIQTITVTQFVRAFTPDMLASWKRDNPPLEVGIAQVIIPDPVADASLEHFTRNAGGVYYAELPGELPPSMPGTITTMTFLTEPQSSRFLTQPRGFPDYHPAYVITNLPFYLRD